jgi:tetratricopeptide (TPR) repeat protein
MRRISTGCILALSLTSSVFAQTTRPADQPIKAVLLEGVGGMHHPVTTKNEEAQKFFDQGINLLYAFNHDESMRSFIKAAELDPKMAMAHWGIAQTLGPNYNVPVDPAREVAAYEEIQKAHQLAAESASEPERDYINALAMRYSNNPKPDLPKLDADYRVAMRELSKKYPDDLDAATLYAESMMLLRPWHLWTHDFEPAEDTQEIVATLESVLSRNPDHIGANHLYIHAVEASAHPERALEAAGRLPGLAPAAGHLVHMPSHIYARVGDYDSAATSNSVAIAADEAYFKNRNDHGVYPMVYYNHNIHFLAFASILGGRSADAMAASEKLAKIAAPHVEHMQMLEAFTIMPTMTMARFGKWDEILALPKPDAKHQAETIAWHVARGLAFAAKGNSEQADQERTTIVQMGPTLAPETMFGMLNSASNIVPLADAYIAGKIAMGRDDASSAIQSFTKAVQAEDKLNYDEPQSWFLNSRDALGAALLHAGKPAEAEKVFRKDLEYNPRNGRSLLGLYQSLRAQEKNYDADWVEQQFQAAWKNADVKLRVEDL